MKRLTGLLLIFSAIFTISNTIVFAQSIPPAPPVNNNGTNYDKCLNMALLKRETALKNAHEKFNSNVQPALDSLFKAQKNATHFSGWLSWMNWFRPMNQAEKDLINRANKVYEEAQQKSQPALDAVKIAAPKQFSTDQQYCINHQDQTYEWTPTNQSALESLGYSGNKSIKSPPASSSKSQDDSYSNSNQPPMPQPDANTISITILSPKTGDVWTQGHKKTVSWNSKTIKQNSTVSYSLESESTPNKEFLSYEENSLGSTYSRSINVPFMSDGKKIEPGTYRLKITVYGRIANSSWPWGTVLAQGVSDYFKIIPGSQTVTQ